MYLNCLDCAWIFVSLFPIRRLFHQESLANIVTPLNLATIFYTVVCKILQNFINMLVTLQAACLCEAVPVTKPFQLVTAEQPNCRWGVLSSSSSACVPCSLHEWEAPQEKKTVAAALSSSCGISWRSAYSAECGAGTWLKKDAFCYVTSSDTEPKVEFMKTQLSSLMLEINMPPRHRR